MAINENRLALKITRAEGKKVQVNVAQVKEVLRVTLDFLSQEGVVAVWRLLRKHRRAVK